MARVQAVEARRTAQTVEAAIAATKVGSQASLVLLLQFLHLHGLFTSSGNGFAPPVLPHAVAQATAQDVAAVRCLYDAFANGPLLGGHGDAIERLAKLESADVEEVIPEVSCMLAILSSVTDRCRCQDQ